MKLPAAHCEETQHIYM